jgi:hypothetical protein
MNTPPELCTPRESGGDRGFWARLDLTKRHCQEEEEEDEDEDPKKKAGSEEGRRRDEDGEEGEVDKYFSADKPGRMSTHVVSLI